MLSIILDVESPPFVRIVLEKKTAPFGGCMLFANQQKKTRTKIPTELATNWATWSRCLFWVTSRISLENRYSLQLSHRLTFPLKKKQRKQSAKARGAVSIQTTCFFLNLNLDVFPIMGDCFSDLHWLQMDQDEPKFNVSHDKKTNLMTFQYTVRVHNGILILYWHIRIPYIIG